MGYAILGAKEPWEKQSDESGVAFEAFVTYRDMGPERSYTKVAKKLNKSQTIIGRWGRAHGWAARIEAWTEEQDRLTREELVKGITAMRKNHASIAEQMLRKALDALQTIPPEEMSMQDISRAVDVAAKLERLSRGEATECTEVTAAIGGKLSVSSAPYEGLTTDDLKNLLKIAEKDENTT